MGHGCRGATSAQQEHTNGGTGVVRRDEGVRDSQGRLPARKAPENERDEPVGQGLPDVAWAAINAAVGRSWALKPQWRKWLTAGAKEMGGWESWTLIARWISEGREGDGDAVFLRETRKNPETVIRARNRGGYHEQAKDWERRRRGVSRSETHAHNGYVLPPEKAFAHALAIVVRHGEHFDRWHEDDRTHAALARAVSSCGGRRWVGEVTQYTRREREKRLCEAYRREWGGCHA